MIGHYTKITLVKESYETDGFVVIEDQSTKEQLESVLKHRQVTNKFRMPNLKLIRQELEE